MKRLRYFDNNYRFGLFLAIIIYINLAFGDNTTTMISIIVIGIPMSYNLYKTFLMSEEEIDEALTNNNKY